MRVERDEAAAWYVWIIITSHSSPFCFSVSLTSPVKISLCLSQVLRDPRPAASLSSTRRCKSSSTRTGVTNRRPRHTILHAPKQHDASSRYRGDLGRRCQCTLSRTRAGWLLLRVRAEARANALPNEMLGETSLAESRAETRPGLDLLGAEFGAGFADAATFVVANLLGVE